MSTDIRPELSKRNKYHIDKERYYELKHFCLQYKTWKKRLGLISLTKSADILYECRSNANVHRPTEDVTVEILKLNDWIALVDKAAAQSDPVLGVYILKAVTEGYTFQQIEASCDIPCGRDMFYDRYRKFFWILDKNRQ